MRTACVQFPGEVGPVTDILDRIGLCQWFHFEDKRLLQATLNDLAELGIRHLRTGISWADYHRSNGERWYDYQMDALADADVEVLLSIWHVPPSLSENGRCSGPPRQLRDYADFVGQIIDRYQGKFHYLELWNEPNNRIKWDFVNCDPDWSKFAKMISAAAYWAKCSGQTTVLGGMIPVDHYWLENLALRGALDCIDIVGIHAFPGMWTGDSYWWDSPNQWSDWSSKIRAIEQYTGNRPVWVTETGYATCKGNSPLPGCFREQTFRLFDAVCAPAKRLYWYCVRDMSYDFPCIEMAEDGGRIDYREYHLGLTTSNGRRKPAWHLLYQLLQKESISAVSIAATRQI